MQNGPNKTVPQVSLWHRPWVVAIAGIFALAVLFAGQAVYYRNQIDQRLQSASHELPLMPGHAAQIFRPVLYMRNWMTLGRAQEARQEFMRNLRDSALRTFAYSPLPTAPEFQTVNQSVAAIAEMRPMLGEESDVALRLIARAARDAVERVHRKGTWSSLDSAMSMFDMMYRLRAFSTAIIPDYEAWRAEMWSVDRSRMMLRDTQEMITGFFGSSLQRVGLGQTESGAAFLSALPPVISDNQFALSISALDQAIKTLLEYEDRFPDNVPPAVDGWMARLRFNRGMVLLTHVVDRGESLGRMGSEFMASRIIRSSASTVPPPEEMRLALQDMIAQDLSAAWGLLDDDSIEPDAEHWALMRLAIWRGLELLRQTQKKPAGELPPRALYRQAGADQAQAVMDAYRPMVLLRLY